MKTQHCLTSSMNMAEEDNDIFSIRDANLSDGEAVYDMMKDYPQKTLEDVLFVIEHEKSISKVSVMDSKVVGKFLL